jgi:TonB family protein
VFHATLIDIRTMALVASVTLHATIFAAAVSPTAARSASSSHEEPDVTIDLLTSPEATSAIVDSAPAIPDGNAAPVRVSRTALVTHHRSSDDGRPANRSPQASTTATAQTDDAPSFTIAIGSNVASAPIEAPGKEGGLKAGIGPKDGDDASLPEDGVSSPAKLTVGAAPPYPEGARAKGVEADVPLEIVVSPAGAVEDARPLSHVGYGLDDAAMAAVRQYRFRPAVKDGRPVRVRMRWIMQFRLW